jgi:hypothetical protein
MVFYNAPIRRSLTHIKAWIYQAGNFAVAFGQYPETTPCNRSICWWPLHDFLSAMPSLEAEIQIFRF